MGGPAARYVGADREQTLISVADLAYARGEPLLVLGGGSNMVVGDAGFPGTALHVLTRGVATVCEDKDRVWLDVAAGETWDDFVQLCVAQDWAGVEALSGIPGSVGGTPIQNVGAYGQCVKETISAVRAYDRVRGEIVSLSCARCAFGYRRSLFQEDRERFLVLGVTFMLRRSSWSESIEHKDLLRQLGLSRGSVARLAEVRAAVLQVRAAKGMVLDPSDHDTWSVGSFFKNPTFDAESLLELVTRIRGRLGAHVELPDSVREALDAGEGGRFPAAWLIANAGFKPGHRPSSRPNASVSISEKHVLALTNRGGGTTSELLTLAREIADRVEREFGVVLEPEPQFVGVRWC
jgi:UDP-N-acetylmuramate dehydrogenase